MTLIRRRQKFPPFYDAGSEGIAYCASTETAFVENLWRAVAADAPSKSLSDKYKATISFELGDLRAFKVGDASTTITMPLANTIFVNGKQSTMFASRWLKRQGATGIAQVRTLEHRHQTAKLPTGTVVHALQSAELEGARDRAFTLAMPLIPITQFRTIKSCRGNIIRTLAKPSTTQAAEAGEELTASQELEAVVAEYFKSRGLPPQAIDAWALVIPKALAEREAGIVEHVDNYGPSKEDSLKRYQDLKQEAYAAAPFPAIWRGARLHRVLSGGGGWGQKAGLISLDPDTTYGNEDAAETSPQQRGVPGDIRPATDGSFDDLDFMFKSVVSPGDHVKFYLQPPLDNESYVRPRHDISLTTRRRRSLDFGVIPSSVDVMGSEGGGGQEADGIPDVEHIPAHFGALSETGMTVRHVSKRIPDVVQTKIDVPFARYSYAYVRDTPVTEVVEKGPVRMRKVTMQ